MKNLAMLQALPSIQDHRSNLRIYRMDISNGTWEIRHTEEIAKLRSGWNISEPMVLLNPFSLMKVMPWYL